MYSVVHLVRSDEVAVLPSVWITGEKVFWPPFKSSIKLTKSVQQCMVPQQTWESMTVGSSITGKCSLTLFASKHKVWLSGYFFVDAYEKARKMAITAGDI